MKKFAPPPLPVFGRPAFGKPAAPPKRHFVPPPAAQGGPGALQMAKKKFRPKDISFHAPKLLTVAKAENSSVQEVQIMKLGTDGYMSSNSSGHLGITSDAIEKYNTYIEGSNSTKSDLRDKFVRAKNEFHEKLREDFTGVDGTRHAEQNLVLKACRTLKSAETNKRLGQINKTIMIYGSKPPCNMCRKVMFAFERALMIVYGMNLAYNRSVGDTSVNVSNSGLLTAEEIAAEVKPGEGTTFQRFLQVYKQYLGN